MALVGPQTPQLSKKTPSRGVLLYFRAHEELTQGKSSWSLQGVLLSHAGHLCCEARALHTQQAFVNFKWNGGCQLTVGDLSAFVSALCAPLLIFHAVMDASPLGGNVNSSATHFPAGPRAGGQGVEERERLGFPVL